MSNDFTDELIWNLREFLKMVLHDSGRACDEVSSRSPDIIIISWRAGALHDE